MFNQSSGLSIHNDVLNAQPSDGTSALALIDECKRRAKASMGSKNYPEAISLYTKSIDVCPALDTNALAILYANRSLAHINMNFVEAASKDADMAIASDISYLKAHFRKVMALIAMQEYQRAREIINKCLEKQPTDTDFQKQLLIVETKISEAAATTPQLLLSVVRPASSSSPSSVASVSKTPSSSSAAAVTMKDGKGDVQDDAEPSVNLRGYKLTSDGRKTTFFNNELDEKTKALIGNIAPKKLDPSSSSGPAPITAGASAWNSAGTFESVDHCTSH